MRISEDETLLSWETTEVASNTASADVLASDPKDFIEARNLIPFTSDEPIAPYSMTHRGLRIWLQLFRLHDSVPGSPNDIRQWVRPIRAPIMIFSSSDDLVWSPLRCHVAHDFHNFVMIPLRHVSADMYVRDTSTNIALVPIARLTNQPSFQEVFIRNSRISSISDSVQRQFGIFIRYLPSEFTIASVVPSEAWDPRSRILQANKDATGRRSWNASLQLSLSGALTRAKTSIFLSLGCKQEGKADPLPWCFIDDFVYTSDNVHLSSFHDSIFSAQPRHEVTNPKDCDGIAYGFGLRVKMSVERIFGQRMFVVDIERRGSENENQKSGPLPPIPTINIETSPEGDSQNGTETSFVRSRRRSISSRPTDR